MKEKRENLRIKREISFKEKINQIHNNKYCLDKVYYTNRGCKVIIGCPKHGDVEVNSDLLLRGGICPLCQNEMTTEFRKRGTKNRTQEEWIVLCEKKHKNKYNYNETNFKQPREDGKVKIICPIHGEFWQNPSQHLRGQGCPNCIKNKKLTLDEFIDRAREIHGDKYDYSKVNYINSSTKICIICSVHGEFWQTPHMHLHGQGCLRCAKDTLKMINSMETNVFIDRAKEIHGDKYDYSKVNYINNHTKVCIICPVHGEFYIRPLNHLHLKQGCSKCANVECLGVENFIDRAREIHGDKYDYSKVEYVNNHTKVCIICPKHGEFWQTPNRHLCGCGCPICNESKLEREVNKLLIENKINFEYQKKFDWLDKQSLDFYLPEYNIAIECQGRQHFMCDLNGWNNIEHLHKTLLLDKRKMELCLKHNIVILYYSNLNIEYPYFVIEGKHNLLKEINKY